MTWTLLREDLQVVAVISVGSGREVVFVLYMQSSFAPHLRSIRFLPWTRG